MKLTTNHKKLICLSAVAIVVYYAPSVIMHFRTPQRAQAVRAGLPVQPAQLMARFGDLIGQYQGQAILPPRGVCTLRFELQPSHETVGRFSGYSRFACKVRDASLRPIRLNQWVFSIRPVSAVLSGTPQDGNIQFAVDEVIGPRACTPTSFTIRRFGVRQIAAAWKDKCGGGSMILNRNGH